MPLFAITSCHNAEWLSRCCSSISRVSPSARSKSSCNGRGDVKARPRQRPAWQAGRFLDLHARCLAIDAPQQLLLRLLRQEEAVIGDAKVHALEFAHGVDELAPSYQSADVATAAAQAAAVAALVSSASTSRTLALALAPGMHCPGGSGIKREGGQGACRRHPGIHRLIVVVVEVPQEGVERVSGFDERGVR